MKYILLIVCIFLITGCMNTEPVCYNHQDRGCTCENVSYQEMTIDFIGDKCNCCAKNPIQNEDGTYRWETKCYGGNVFVKTYCVYGDVK